MNLFSAGRLLHRRRGQCRTFTNYLSAGNEHGAACRQGKAARRDLVGWFDPGCVLRKEGATWTSSAHSGSSPSVPWSSWGWSFFFSCCAAAAKRTDPCYPAPGADDQVRQDPVLIFPGMGGNSQLQEDRRFRLSGLQVQEDRHSCLSGQAETPVLLPGAGGQTFLSVRTGGNACPPTTGRRTDILVCPDRRKRLSSCSLSSHGA